MFVLEFCDFQSLITRQTWSGAQELSCVLNRYINVRLNETFKLTQQRYGLMKNNRSFISIH